MSGANAGRLSGRSTSNSIPLTSRRRAKLLPAVYPAIGALLFASHATAGTLYWSPAGNDLGGTGQWDNSITSDWWDGSAPQVWNSPAGQDVAVFDGTAGVVTINTGETINVNSMVFNTSGYSITGDSTTTLNLTGNGIITTNTGTTTITAPIQGGNMDVEGAGTLAINNIYNYIQGTVTVGSGATLNVSSPANGFELGTSENLTGGTLLYSTVAGYAIGTGISIPLKVIANSTIQYNNLSASTGANGSSGAANYFYGGLTLGANLALDAQTYAANFYYGMPNTIFQGGLSLNNNATLTVSGVVSGGANTATFANGISGNYTLTKAGNGNLTVGTGGNYSGLNISGGIVNVSDLGGFPTSTLTLAGGMLYGSVPAGSTVTVASTAITAPSTLEIDQPGNSGGSAYNLGAVTLGANLNVTQPAAYNYYWGQSTLNFTATTLTTDSTLNLTGGSNGGGIFTVNTGPITGPHTLAVTGTSPVNIGPGGNYAGLVLAGGAAQISDVGGFPTGTLNLAGGALTLVAGPGVTVTDTTSTTLVSTNSTINIQQPSSVGYGSSNAATYNLGQLTLGANLTISQSGGPGYYYGQPKINFTAVSLTTDATLSVTSQTSGGDPTDSIGPINGNHTLTIAGANALVNILPGTGNSYSGLVITTTGGVEINDASGFPTGTLNLAGGALALAAAPGVTVTDTTVNTLVSTNSVINIQQPSSVGYGSSGAATYNLGPVTLGANLTVAQPTSGPGYYSGQPQISSGPISLVTDATLSISSQTAGGVPTDSIGPISGNHTLTIAGSNAVVNILAGTGGAYSGLVVTNTGGVTLNDAGGFPTATLALTGSSPLNLYAPAYSVINDTTVATTVSASQTINIDQSGSNSYATYNLGSLSIGASTLTMALTNPADYYYGGIAQLNFGATTLTGNATFVTTGSTFSPKLGSITGAGFSLTKSGSANLTLSGSDTYTGGTNVSGGTLIVTGSNGLPVGGNLTVGTGAGVQLAAHNGSSANVIVATVGTLANSGVIDVTNNDLLVGGGATLVGITGQFMTGAITSSSIAGNPLTTLGIIQASGATTLDGVAVPAGDIELKYTYYGDANLDGAVDGSDYTLIDAGFNSHLTGWANGDFNYDGVVDGSDYTLIDNAFNTQGSTLGTNPAAQLASATSQIAGGTSAVPEPATLGLLGLGAISLLGRRNRRK